MGSSGAQRIKLAAPKRAWQPDLYATVAGDQPLAM
jgi:hypothetical protein